MRKQFLGLLGASASLLAMGQASAGALGAPNEIFIGGATAVQRTFHLDLMIRFCATAGTPGAITPTVYADTIADLPGGGDPNAATPALTVGNQVAVHCTFKAGLPSPLAGAEVAVYKFNGGSATGVAPVADPAGAAAGDITYMDGSPATCPLVTNADPGNLWTSVDGTTRFQLRDCPTTTFKTQAPDGGISDVEPKIFVGQLASGFGTELPGVPQKPQDDFIDQGNLQVKAGAGIIFGVGVTLPLYNELVSDQFGAGLLPACTGIATQAQRDRVECMPSLPTAMIPSLFSGEISSWATRAPYGLALNTASVNQGNKVNICRRTAGSGTHAQFSVEYLRTNCVNASPTMRTFANNVPPPVQAPQVYENAGSGDVDTCLNTLATGVGFNGGFPDGFTAFPGAPTPISGGDSSVIPVGRTAFGIGYNSLERNTALSRAYRFVKIDGAAPTLEEAFTGNYRDIYYLSYQNRVLPGTTTPDPRLGAIRTVAVDASERAVHAAFFSIWNSPSAAAVQAVNDGLIVDPDGIAGNGDEWQGGFLQPSGLAPQVFGGGPLGTNPLTPWSRETSGGQADSCQNLTLVN